MIVINSENLNIIKLKNCNTCGSQKSEIHCIFRKKHITDNIHLECKF